MNSKSNDAPATPPNPGDGLGQLRESLSALRNLQQLLASLHAGPKLLSGLLPEVQSAASRMSSTSAELLDYVKGRSSYPDELTPIKTYAVATSQALDDLLADAVDAPLLARKRLQLESTIKQMTPELTSLVEHIELLLEASSGVSVSLPLAELLSSRPSHGSSRPLHELLVVGPAEDAILKLPPRVGLGAFCLLSQTTSLEGRPAVRVSPDRGGLIRLEFSRREEVAESEQPRLTSLVPVAHRIPPSFSVAKQLLCSFGAEFTRDEPAVFTLPAAGDPF